MEKYARRPSARASTTATSRARTPSTRDAAVIAQPPSGAWCSRDGDDSSMTMDGPTDAAFRLAFFFFPQTGSEEEYMQDGPITVFAPNDDALGDFAKAQGLSKVDLMNYDGLKDVILNHAPGKFESGSMRRKSPWRPVRLWTRPASPTRRTTSRLVTV